MSRTACSASRRSYRGAAGSSCRNPHARVSPNAYVSAAASRLPRADSEKKTMRRFGGFGGKVRNWQ